MMHSYQLAGHTESTECAVHNNILDDLEDLSVFVNKEILCLCEA